VRAVWGKKLLTGFRGQTGIPSGYGRISKGNRVLTRDFSNHTRQVIIGHSPGLLPRGKPSGFTVVSIRRQDQFGTDEKDFSVQSEDTAVVSDVLMQDGHPNIAKYLVRQISFKNFAETFPGMKKRVLL
jgi:hypothetical protein